MKSQLKILIMGIAMICVSLLFNNYAYAEEINIPNWASNTTKESIITGEMLADQRTFVTLHYSETLNFWDSKNAQLVNKVTLPKSFDRMVVIGNEIYLATSRNAIYQYDMVTGEVKLIREEKEGGYSNTRLITLNDNLIAYASKTDTYVIDVKTGEDKWVFSTNEYVNGIVYNDQLKHLAILYNNRKNIEVKDITNGESVASITLPLNDRYINRNEFAYIGNYIYTYSRINSNGHTSLVYDAENNYSQIKSNLPEYYTEVQNINSCLDERFLVVNDTMYDLQQGGLKVASDNKWRKVKCYNETMINISSYDLQFYDLKELTKLKSIQDITVVAPETEWLVENNYDIRLRIQYNDGSAKDINASDVTWHTNNFYTAAIVDGKVETREAGEVTLSTTYLGRKLSITKQVYNHIPLDKDKYHVMAKKTTADTKKVWEINLTRGVSYKDIEDKNIVITDARGYLVPTLYVIDGAAKDKIKVIPTRPYKVGEVYTLWINGLYAEDGNQALANDVRMDFEIKK